MRGLAHDLVARLYDDTSGALLFTNAVSFNGGVTDAAYQHQPVDTNAHVLATLRVLAETAHTYQTSSPRERDPTGAHTRTSAERLARAVAILQTFQLMTTINRRAAAENSIALIGEVQEHTIRVDDVLVTSVEREIRYRLDDLIAFHASGITQEDLDTVARFVQAGLLAWIGSGV